MSSDDRIGLALRTHVAAMTQFLGALGGDADPVRAHLVAMLEQAAPVDVVDVPPVAPEDEETESSPPPPLAAMDTVADGEAITPAQGLRIAQHADERLKLRRLLAETRGEFEE